jgi:hypothetical protein
LGEKVQKLENELIKPKDRHVYELKDFESNLMYTRLNLNKNKLIQTSTGVGIEHTKNELNTQKKNSAHKKNFFKRFGLKIIFLCVEFY